MADIITHGSLTTSLVSYWEMEESSGNRADSHGSNTLSANGSGGVGSGTGKIGTCANLVASELDYLSILDASQTGLDFGGDMSFSFWVKFTSLPSSGNLVTICSKQVSDGSDGAYALQVYNLAGSYKIRPTVFDSGNPTENLTGNVGSFSPDTTNWFHIVWTFTESSFTSEGFINGSSIGTYTHTGYDGTLQNSAGPFLLGILRTTGAQPYDGLIDEVGAWSKILSGTEITDLYNSGSGLPYEEAGGTPTTTARKHTLALMGVG